MYVEMAHPESDPVDRSSIYPAKVAVSAELARQETPPHLLAPVSRQKPAQALCLKSVRPRTEILSEEE